MKIISFLQILLLLGAVFCGVVGARDSSVFVSGVSKATDQNSVENSSGTYTGGTTVVVPDAAKATDQNAVENSSRTYTGGTTVVVPDAAKATDQNAVENSSGTYTRGTTVVVPDAAKATDQNAVENNSSTYTGGSTTAVPDAGNGIEPNSVKGTSFNSKGVHLDKSNLPLSCATCHFRSNLKSGGGSEGCITCHGNPQRKNSPAKMPPGAVIARSDLKNIEAAFYKTFRHPTFDNPGRHRSNEILPETDSKALRHADCVDCHHPHFVTSENRFAGIKGKRIVNQVAEVTKEFELCYRCHGDSVNLPGKYTNKRIEFSLNNPSFHPVEGEGKSSTVVSLVRPYKERKVALDDVSVIACSDCHGNDEADGPKGVHGSRNRFILKDNFDASDNISESSYTYALCYRCHSRTSILGNESFKYHSLHIQGKSITLSGTSCFTCHNSHGSVDSKYLIQFNKMVVSPNSKGLLKFVEKGSAKFSGECYLTCHGVEHNPKSY